MKSGTMTHSDFEKHLRYVLSDQSAIDMLSVPGVAEILMEHFNNDVLDSWRTEQEMAEEELEDDEPTPAFIVHCAGCNGKIDTDKDSFGSHPGKGLLCLDCWQKHHCLPGVTLAEQELLLKEAKHWR
jgi:hypothetical protein